MKSQHHDNISVLLEEKKTKQEWQLYPNAENKRRGLSSASSHLSGIFRPQTPPNTTTTTLPGQLDFLKQTVRGGGSGWGEEEREKKHTHTGGGGEEVLVEELIGSE